MVATLKSLSHNSNIWIISALIYIDYLFSFQVDIFQVLVMMNDFYWNLDILGIILWKSRYYLKPYIITGFLWHWPLREEECHLITARWEWKSGSSLGIHWYPVGQGLLITAGGSWGSSVELCWYHPYWGTIAEGSKPWGNCESPDSSVGLLWHHLSRKREVYLISAKLE